MKQDLVATDTKYDTLSIPKETSQSFQEEFLGTELVSTFGMERIHPLRNDTLGFISPKCSIMSCQKQRMAGFS